MRLSEQAKQEVQWRFEDLKKIRFPKVPPGEDQAGHLRAELVLYDAYVAGYLTRLLAGTDIDPKHLYFDADLKGQLEELGRRRPDLAAFVGGCLDYLSVIHSLIRAARRVAQ